MTSYEVHGALAGKILRVDLSRKKVWTEDTAPYARRFLGGRGINSYLLLNEMRPSTKWSDPDNMLLFGVGFLVGTLAPGACRVSIDTKNPYTGGKGSANFGGHFGAELKYAGFDHVVITGRSEAPSYLWIEDGEAEIRDAGFLWGKRTNETEEALQNELRDERIKIAAIGPAGENLVRSACVISDMAKAAGGCGVGCVMGSKNLKAIAVRGHGAIGVGEPSRFISAVNDSFAKINSSPNTPGWRKGIIEAYCFPESPLWDLAGEMIRNGQIGNWPMEKRINLAGKDTGVPKYRKNMTACFNCPIGCMPYFEIEEGAHKGTRGIGYWINSAFYSARFDVDDPAASLKFHLMLNQLGLDGDTASTVLSWAFECYEKGLLTKADTEGLELEWGNADAMLRLEEDLAYRRGLGRFLADGVQEAARRLGKGSEAFAIQVKGQDTCDPFRIQKGWGLGCSTSPCGPRHLRGAVGVMKHSGPKDLPRDTTHYENQPEAVFWELRAKEIEDMTGLCNYVGTYSGARALEPADYAELSSAALGIEISEKEIMRVGQTTYNLEKAFNTIHAGFRREDDYPPRRYMEEPVDSGPYAGNKCEKEMWDDMLDRFYQLHGWDMKTGLQTRRCLKDLELEDVGARLEKMGKLID
jgi:aldehyde:ferredoxin oxidoreductase